MIANATRRRVFRAARVVALTGVLRAPCAAAESEGTPPSTDAAPATPVPGAASPAGTASPTVAPDARPAAAPVAAPAVAPAAAAQTASSPDVEPLPLEAPPEPPVSDEPPTAPSAEIHGFVSQGYIKTTANNYLAASTSTHGSFEFAEVGLNVTATPLDRLRIGAQLFAHDLGPLGNYRTRFDWFYLDYRFQDWLGVRAGRTKIPFGLYNETNDVDAGRVPILLPQSVYPIQNRDFLLAQTGGELYGTVRLGEAGAVEYRGYGGTLYLDPIDSQNQLVNPSVPYLAGGRLMWQAPVEGLQAGGSLQALRLEGGFAPSAAQVTQLQGKGALPAGFSGTASFEIRAVLGVASVEYSARDLLVAAEYSRWGTHVESDLAALVPKADAVSERLYAMTSYRLSPWLVPGVYYSVLFSDTEQRTTPGQFQHDVAGTLRFDINPHWLLKLEGHFMHGTAALKADLNGNVPSVGTLEPNWGVLLVKTTGYF